MSGGGGQRRPRAAGFAGGGGHGRRICGGAGAAQADPKAADTADVAARVGDVRGQRPHAVADGRGGAPFHLSFELHRRSSNLPDPTPCTGKRGRR